MLSYYYFYKVFKIKIKKLKTKQFYKILVKHLQLGVS